MGKQKTFSFVSFSCICLAILREREKKKPFVSFTTDP